MPVQKRRQRAPYSQIRKDRARATILARQAWVNETIRLREAVDADDEELARILLKRIFKARREEAA